MSDIYQAPTAQLNQSGQNGEYGSLAKGISGDYVFSIGDTLSEAWAKTSGKKLTFFLAFFTLIIITMIGTQVLGSILVGPLMSGPDGLEYAMNNPAMFSVGLLLYIVLVGALIVPMNVGFMLLGIYGAVDRPINVAMIFKGYKKIWQIVVATFLIQLLTFVGWLFFILPGIYLSVAYFLALPLIVEKNLGPWEAMEASRKAISKRWFSVFLMMLIFFVLMMLSFLTLTIGLIWAMPLMMLSIGILYRNMFGVEDAGV